MSDTAKQIIEGTFVVLILAWVLTHATEFGQVASSVSGAYTSGVNALMPSKG